jgi:predicted amidohydrolase
MSDSPTLTVALISDVFFGEGAQERLLDRLAAAKEGGAELAVLPEIPVNRWAPATKDLLDDDAEEPGGPLHRMQSDAAGEIGIAVLGGVIERDPELLRGAAARRNTALLFDASGTLVGSFSKCHLPEEPGFWETSHYAAGEAMPVFDALPLRVGVQICSDNNRPVGAHILAAKGAEAILVPRSTEKATWERWRHSFIANAWTTGTYVLSANRPAPEDGVEIGGPSIVVAPNAEVLAESTEPVVVVRLERSAVERARFTYPGYLPERADIYAREWAALADGSGPRVRGYPGR